jgi:hypothetical protein
MISPDLHFRDVLAFMCSNVFNFDFEIGLTVRRALVLANSRDDVTIDNILSHPVGPIPVSSSMKMVQ